MSTNRWRHQSSKQFNQSTNQSSLIFFRFLVYFSNAEGLNLIFFCHGFLTISETFYAKIIYKGEFQQILRNLKKEIFFLSAIISPLKKNKKKGIRPHFLTLFLQIALWFKIMGPRSVALRKGQQTLWELFRSVVKFKESVTLLM